MTSHLYRPDTFGFCEVCQQAGDHCTGTRPAPAELEPRPRLAAVPNEPQPMAPLPGWDNRPNERNELNERTKEARPEVPVPDRLIYRGLVGEITLVAAETSEADPVGIHGSLLAGISADLGPSPYIQIGNTRHPMLICRCYSAAPAPGARATRRPPLSCSCGAPATTSPTTPPLAFPQVKGLSSESATRRETTTASQTSGYS